MTSRPTGTSVSRGHLGAGLIEVPSVPYQDPVTVVMVGPEGGRVKAVLRQLRDRGRPAAGTSDPGELRGSAPMRDGLLFLPQTSNLAT